MISQYILKRGFKPVFYKVTRSEIIKLLIIKYTVSHVEKNVAGASAF